jgi:hypothetical protein
MSTKQDENKGFFSEPNTPDDAAKEDGKDRGVHSLGSDVRCLPVRSCELELYSPEPPLGWNLITLSFDRLQALVDGESSHAPFLLGTCSLGIA